MNDKANEVSFLVDNFSMPAVKAAEVVSDDEAEVAELTAAQLKKEHEDTPYAPGAKIPVSPAQHTVKDNEGLQKEVLYKDNKAGETGP